MQKSFLFLITGILALQFVATSAQACSCIADPFSKKYEYYKKTWYGTKRKWTCVYTCQDAQQQRTQVTGTHEDWYTTDKGLEGICDGLHYVNRYNTYKMDFVWQFEEARWFDASDSSAAELKKWNQEKCR
ncbi:hypothetical protein QJS83_07100 [Bdellovibrio sp. 22V]|uniref:hypothetical protein n=1 Tax=Bdellovibrio TaxID=958 RepID=UPI002542FAD9|nr:hypothetical protein [Bdellovibrio sp. 22V]WII73639.1 hypothetical protein QJS83_07100 [Bdellovibrio sp. 22V]